MCAQYSGSQYSGSGPRIDEPTTATTWRVNGVRVEAIHTDTGMPEVVPGGDASYELYLTDDAPDGVAPLRERYEALLRLIETSRRVDVYEATDAVYYRNQSNADQLVIIEPIAADAIAYSDDPETRNAEWPGRYAVVTGGTDESTFPEGQVLVTLETTTIADADAFDSREDLAAQRERSGV